MTEDVSHIYYPREWALARAAKELPDAGLDDLPAVFARPPWRPRRHPPRTVLNRTAPIRPVTLQWQPGERQRWAEAPVRGEERWREEASTVLGNARSTSPYLPILLAVAPEEVALAQLRVFAPPYRPHMATYRRLVGRFELDAMEFVFSGVRRFSNLAGVLAPADGTAVSLFWAHWMNSGRCRTGAGLRWFDRHIDTAATDLIATALTRSGKDRVPAERTLRILAAAGHGDTIRAAAEAYHPQAPAALDAIVDIDPLLLLPKRIPRLRAWISLDRLPKVLLRRGDTVLPVSAMADLCTMLMMCRPGHDYAGVGAVTEATEPTTLARFARELLDQWVRAGCPQKDDWVLHAQGLIGDHDTVRYMHVLTKRWLRMADSGRAATDALYDGRLAQVGHALYGGA
ncbi:hypothetical protein ACFROC_29410 [Nocardia tengchongensis]|uniref:hypothetical protein n=1 Tax=Nocardia tengchongensis TaxID=2055889 RepID=UPI003676288F